MRVRVGLGLGLYLLTSSMAYAVVPPQQITWVQANVAPASAQTYRYTLTVREEGNPTPKPVSLVNVLCGGPPTAAECSAALPVAAQTAIVTGNTSTLTATHPETGQSSPASAPFTGNQGCIFRNNLFPVGKETSAETRKQDMQALLTEFKRAKFKHISTKQLAGNRFLVTEQCVGFIVP